VGSLFRGDIMTDRPWKPGDFYWRAHCELRSGGFSDIHAPSRRTRREAEQDIRDDKLNCTPREVAGRNYYVQKYVIPGGALHRRESADKVKVTPMSEHTVFDISFGAVQRARAAEITRRWNAHDELLEACEAGLAFIESLPLDMEVSFAPTGFALLNFRNKARDAIGKAKGE